MSSSQPYKPLDMSSDIITAISFSRLNKNILTRGQCIALHQWERQGVEPLQTTKEKFNEIRNLIKEIRWKRPEIKWDNGVQWYYEKDLGKWIELDEINN